MMASTNVSLQDPDKVEHTADQRLSFTGLLSSCVHGVSREVFPAGPCLKMTHKISHRATRSQILLRLLCCLTDRNVTNLITSSAIDFLVCLSHHSSSSVYISLLCLERKKCLSICVWNTFQLNFIVVHSFSVCGRCNLISSMYYNHNKINWQ